LLKAHVHASCRQWLSNAHVHLPMLNGESSIQMVCNPQHLYNGICMLIEDSAAAEQTEFHNGNTCTAPAFGHV
jgi:hypothetical protein